MLISNLVMCRSTVFARKMPVIMYSSIFMEFSIEKMGRVVIGTDVYSLYGRIGNKIHDFM